LIFAKASHICLKSHEPPEGVIVLRPLLWLHCLLSKPYVFHYFSACLPEKLHFSNEFESSDARSLEISLASTFWLPF